MADEPTKTDPRAEGPRAKASGTPQPETRAKPARDRLAAALRANLRRRKAPAPASDRPPGPDASDP